MKQADDQVCALFVRARRSCGFRPTVRASGTWALALALCATFGCTEKTVEQPRQRGLAPGEEQPLGTVVKPAPPPPPPPPAQPPSALASPFATPTPDPGSLQRIEPPAEPGAAVPTPDEPHDKVPQRDLPAELTAQLGAPASCLDLASVATAGGRITIVVTAFAVPSGRITRATVDAPGQPESALRCLEQRATSAHLRSPVPGAPLQVTATIPIEVISQPEPR